jgi:dipeptidase
MATNRGKTEPKRALRDYTVYVPLGAGQLVVEKARGLIGKAWAVAQTPRTTAVQAYQGLADRGEKLANGIRRSAYTRTALEQAKTARSQVKAATTSVRKAAGSSATAAKAAAKKVG